MSTRTDQQGSYELTVPVMDSYIIDVYPNQSPLDLKNGVYGFSYFGLANKVWRGNASSIAADVVLDPVGNLVLKAFDENGTLMREKDFGWQRNVYATDENGIRVDDRFTMLHDALSSSKNWDNGLRLPAVTIPLNHPRSINLLWTVPGFGKIMVLADNGGQGFSLSHKGDVLVINLNYELARTQLNIVNRTVDECTRGAYAIPENVLAKINRAQQFFANASTENNDGMRAILSNKALNDSLYAGEELEYAAAQQSIELHRKNDVTLKIIDQDGNPLSEAKISYTQATHDFLFGVGLTNSENPYHYDVTVFELLKDAGVNYGLPYLTWELTARSPSWVETAYKPKVLHEMGYTLTGHCLVWFYDQFSNLPSYAKQLTFGELKERVRSQILQVVDRYKAWIHIWEISEPNFEYSNSLHLTTPQWIEICRIAAAAIREADPDGKVLVNMLMADLPQIGYYPIQFLQTLVKEGVQFDIVGLELYGNDRTPGVLLDSNGYPEISWVSKRIDEFSQLGKPLFLSEIGVPSKPSEEAQAEWLRQVYTLAFSKAAVQSVTWYNIYAPGSDPFYPDSGLFRAVKPSPEPKLAYYAHKELVSQWTTTGTGNTDESGTVRFRGYAGSYTISVAGYENSTIHVSEGEENAYNLVLKPLTKPSVSTTSTTAAASTVVTTITQSQSSFWLYAAIVIVVVAAGAFYLRRRRN